MLINPVPVYPAQFVSMVVPEVNVPLSAWYWIVVQGMTAFTVTDEEDVKLPSCVVVVMTAFPGTTAVTRPVGLTVATDVLLLLQVTLLLVAFEGATVAVSCCVFPTESVREAGLTATPVAGTFIVLNSMTEAAIRIPQ